MRHAVRAIAIKDSSLLVMHRNKFGQEYYALIGGKIDLGETAEQAIAREVREETGLQVTASRLVYMEQAAKPYGTQHIYLCEVSGGEPKLDPGSVEYKIQAMGKNLYQPEWLPIDQLDKVHFLSRELKEHLIKDLKTGWPDEPKYFTSDSRLSKIEGENGSN